LEYQVARVFERDASHPVFEDNTAFPRLRTQPESLKVLEMRESLWRIDCSVNHVRRQSKVFSDKALEVPGLGHSWRKQCFNPIEVVRDEVPTVRRTSEPNQRYADIPRSEKAQGLSDHFAARWKDLGSSTLQQVANLPFRSVQAHLLRLPRQGSRDAGGDVSTAPELPHPGDVHGTAMGTAKAIPNGLPPAIGLRYKFVELNKDRFHLTDLARTYEALQNVKLCPLGIHLEKGDMALTKYFGYIKEGHLNRGHSVDPCGRAVSSHLQSHKAR